MVTSSSLPTTACSASCRRSYDSPALAIAATACSSTSDDDDERRVAAVVRATVLRYFTENAVRSHSHTVALAATVMTEREWPVVSATGALVVRLVAAVVGADVRLMARALEYTRTSLASDVAANARRSDELVRQCAAVCVALVLASVSALEPSAYVAHVASIANVALDADELAAFVARTSLGRAVTCVYDMYEPLAALVAPCSPALGPVLVLAAFDSRLATNPLFTAAATVALSTGARARLVRVLASMNSSTSIARTSARLRHYERLLVDVLAGVRHSPLLALVGEHATLAAAIDSAAYAALTTSDDDNRAN